MTRGMWRQQTSYVEVDIIGCSNATHNNFVYNKKRLYVKGSKTHNLSGRLGWHEGKDGN